MSTGIGRHSTLRVPGRNTLIRAPNDWPEALYAGSLNVRIDQYPVEFRQHGLADTVVELDTGRFAPEFEIFRDELGNNQLGPRPDAPRGGDAQVWRAKISVPGAGPIYKCWALRRFGSRVGEQLEFVADQRLRDLGLKDGQRVLATLLGVWRDA